MNPNKCISWGFVLAGLANIIGVSTFSMFLTNQYLSELSPIVMSRFGLVCVILWGFTYISVAKQYQHLQWLIFVFAIEKMLYAWSWWDFVQKIDFNLAPIYAESVLTGLFYTVYGANDFLSALFFFYVLWHLKKSKTANSQMNRNS